ncbi:MAG: hypothetical protein HYZ81_27410 [Nitrospinae bacterium]|nr:hypothetical protein [Nitrospinota bacterium]
MRSIDIHAHLTPQCFWRATQGNGDWHSIRREQDARGRGEMKEGYTCAASTFMPI